MVQYLTDDSKECHKVTIKCEAYGKTSSEAAESAKKTIERFVEKAKEARGIKEEEKYERRYLL